MLTLYPLFYSARFERYKPEFFNLSNMVEVQVSFQAIKIGKHDYVFLPKLRSLCLINRDAEVVSDTCTLKSKIERAHRRS